MTGYTWDVSMDIFVLKVDGRDGSVIWDRRYHNDTGDSCGYGICSDPSGNAVACGCTSNGSNYDIWVRKYRGSDGYPLWTDTYEGGSNDFAYGVCSDSSGNPVVAGRKDGIGVVELWLRKYLGADGSELWTDCSLTGVSWSVAYDVALDFQGNVVVAGLENYSEDMVLQDCTLARKYTSSGDLLFSVRYRSGEDEAGYAVSVDSSGDFAIAGTNIDESKAIVRECPPDHYYPYYPTVTTREPADLEKKQAVGFSIERTPESTTEPLFQLSPDGENYYYNIEGEWVEANCLPSEANTEQVVGQHIPWYLAEGYTAEGFDTYILVENPTGDEALIQATFMKPGGETVTKDYRLKSSSRFTIEADRIEGLSSTEFSTLIRSTNGTGIVCERAIYFSYRDKWSGGHDALGVNQPSATWYFAEGYTGY